jgi:hypothetical protein
MRTCIRCGEAKPEEGFRLRKSVSTGLHYRGKICRACHQAKSNEWGARNREKRREYTRKCYKKNAPAYRKQASAYALVKKFGITPEQRDEMLAAQGGCAICKSKTTGTRRAWHVDHCHSTGKIRGILCHSCNVGIGHFKEDPAILTAAISYLGK